jgi:hypothetical protein
MNVIDALLLVIALAVVGGAIAAVYGYYQGMPYMKWSGIMLILAAIMLAIGLGAFDSMTPEMFIRLVSGG